MSQLINEQDLVVMVTNGTSAAAAKVYTEADDFTSVIWGWRNTDLTKTFGSVDWAGNGASIPTWVLLAEFAIIALIFFILVKVITPMWLKRDSVQALAKPE